MSFSGPPPDSMDVESGLKEDETAREEEKSVNMDDGDDFDDPGNEGQDGSWKEVKSGSKRGKFVRGTAIPATIPRRKAKPAASATEKFFKVSTPAEKERSEDYRSSDGLRYADSQGRKHVYERVATKSMARIEGPAVSVEAMGKTVYSYIVIQGFPITIIDNVEEIHHRIEYVTFCRKLEVLTDFTTVLVENGCFGVVAKIKSLTCEVPAMVNYGLEIDHKGQGYAGPRPAMASTLLPEIEGKWMVDNHYNVIGLARGIGGSVEEMNLRIHHLANHCRCKGPTMVVAARILVSYTCEGKLKWYPQLTAYILAARSVDTALFSKFLGIRQRSNLPSVCEIGAFAFEVYGSLNIFHGTKFASRQLFMKERGCAVLRNIRSEVDNPTIYKALTEEGHLTSKIVAMFHRDAREPRKGVKDVCVVLEKGNQMLQVGEVVKGLGSAEFEVVATTMDSMPAALYTRNVRSDMMRWDESSWWIKEERRTEGYMSGGGFVNIKPVKIASRSTNGGRGWEQRTEESVARETMDKGNATGAQKGSEVRAGGTSLGSDGSMTSGEGSSHVAGGVGACWGASEPWANMGAGLSRGTSTQETNDLIKQLLGTMTLLQQEAMAAREHRDKIDQRLWDIEKCNKADAVKRMDQQSADIASLRKDVSLLSERMMEFGKLSEQGMWGSGSSVGPQMDTSEQEHQLAGKKRGPADADWEVCTVVGEIRQTKLQAEVPEVIEIMADEEFTQTPEGSAIEEGSVSSMEVAEQKRKQEGRLMVTLTEGFRAKGLKGDYSQKLGRGVKACQRIEKDETVLTFVGGEQLTAKAARERVDLGARYLMQGTKCLFFDFARARAQGELGSAVNSPLYVKDLDTGKMVQGNCKLVYCNKVFKLVATRTILAADHIWYHYGKGYKMIMDVEEDKGGMAVNTSAIVAPTENDTWMRRLNGCRGQSPSFKMRMARQSITREVAVELGTADDFGDSIRILREKVRVETSISVRNEKSNTQSDGYCGYWALLAIANASQGWGLGKEQLNDYEVLFDFLSRGAERAKANLRNSVTNQQLVKEDIKRIDILMGLVASGQRAIDSYAWATRDIIEHWDHSLKLTIWTGETAGNRLMLGYANGRSGNDFSVEEVEIAIGGPGPHIINLQNSHWDVVYCETSEWEQLMGTLLAEINAIFN